MQCSPEMDKRTDRSTCRLKEKRRRKKQYFTSYQYRGGGGQSRRLQHGHRQGYEQARQVCPFYYSICQSLSLCHLYAFAASKYQESLDGIGSGGQRAAGSNLPPSDLSLDCVESDVELLKDGVTNLSFSGNS